MTGDKALHISNCIAAYNKAYGHPRNGHRSFCKIEEFVEYPETQKNGANFALKFKTNLNDCTFEYKDFDQLKAWFNFHLQFNMNMEDEDIPDSAEEFEKLYEQLMKEGKTLLK